jgi:PAS domain S-box-containing protein
MVALLFCAMALLAIIVAFYYLRFHLAQLEMERWCRVLDNVAEGIVVLDRERRIVSVNGAMTRLFGHEPAALIGRTLDVVLPGGLPEPGRECIGRRKDDSTIHLEVEASAPAEGTRSAATTLILRDVTTSKKAHETLTTRETYLRMVVEQMPAILWTTDMNLQITSTIGAGLAAVHLQARELIGMSMLECLERDQLECTPISAHMKALRGESLSYEMEWKGRTFQVRVDPLRSSTKRITGTIGILIDITDLKQAVADLKRLEEQLRQAQKMEAVGRLAGGIAHDFNNLLCIITGYSSLVAEGLPAEEPLREFVGEITKASERATGLTQQLLAFSRKQMLMPRVLSLNTLLTGLDRMLRRLIGEDIELSTTLGDDLHPVKADQTQIEQILMNLVVNARDAMPRGGRLSIATANIELSAADLRDSPEVAPGPFACLEVSDTGCGMDREVMAHLFEPFFTTKGQGKGTGLGLATVFGIVKQSGGLIRVASEPGRGTTFRIYLPRLQAEEPAEAHAPSAETSPCGGKETLLLVEDEDGLRALACHTLRQRGYHILEASNGEEALEISRQHAGVIDLLLSDVVMPKLGGHALAERLLAERPQARILFMSGFTDSALFRHGVVSGEVECLFKPFTPSALAEKVREVLDRAAPHLLLNESEPLQ